MKLLFEKKKIAIATFNDYNHLDRLYNQFSILKKFSIPCELPLISHFTGAIILQISEKKKENQLHIFQKPLIDYEVSILNKKQAS